MRTEFLLGTTAAEVCCSSYARCFFYRPADRIDFLAWTSTCSPKLQNYLRQLRLQFVFIGMKMQAANPHRASPKIIFKNEHF